MFEESVGWCSDTGESVQFQLQLVAGFAAAVAARDEPTRDEAQLVATSLELEAREFIERLAVAQTVDHAGVRVPLPADRPGGRELRLLQAIALRAIREVHDAIIAGPV